MEKQAIDALTADQALAQLQSSPSGISEMEAASRLKQYGQNVLTKNKTTALGILGRQFKSSLIYLLAFACVLSFILHDLSDGLIIAVILVLNTALGFFQEFRSEKAVEKLATFISRRVSVERNGQTVLQEVAQLVPGDILFLKEGDIVPADCKLLAAENLQVNESQLTGESLPVNKTADLSGGPSTENIHPTLLFTGSVIEKGGATALVFAIGDHTELGSIASLSTQTRKVTQYQKSLEAFSSLLLKVVLVTLAATFVLKLLIAHDLSRIPELLLFAVALAVAVVPEALPVIATLTLSTGAMQLAKQHVVVKRLASVEDLGNITMLCTDKTGTLTEGKMTVQSLVAEDPLHLQLLTCAALQSNQLVDSSLKNTYSAALMAYIPAEVKDQAKTFRWVEELPFDPEARRNRTIIEDLQTRNRYLVVMGAVETLLGLSDADNQKREQVLAAAAGSGRQGLRTFALAYRQIPTGGPIDILKEEQHLSFLGFAILIDPLRPTAKETIDQAESLGVSVKILSGDSKEVAAYVGDQLGLGSTVYSGDEIAQLAPEQLRKVASECNVFARVSPAQKYAIVEALKHDYVVGYQGDGINDAPALKLADVGLAVDTATDVAKESADIVLLRQDLSVIINGIRSGRAVFHDIDKYLKYTMVGNFGNLFAMAVLYLFALNLPLLPVQLLLTSLITDIPLVTIASDTVEKKDTLRPEKYDARSLILLSVFLGSCTAVFELLFFALAASRTPMYLQTSMFLFLTLLQLIVIVSIRSREPFWKGSTPSPLLSLAMGLAFLVSLALPYIPPVGSLFSFKPLPASEMVIVLGLTLIYVLILDRIKVWYYRRAGGGIPPVSKSQFPAQVP